jgi:hydroxyacylglutathione hydrolase
MTTELVDFATDAPVSGDLSVRWIHGTRGRRAPADPKIQVYAYDPHSYVLRQSKAVSYEAPFLFLLFGNDRALLLDTGASKKPEGSVREIVDGLISTWLAEHPRDDYELVVAHTHGHNDHVAGDEQFAGRPATTVVSRPLAAVQEFFGFTSWPDQVVTLDLGGRVLEITGSTGHHRAAITVYDPWTGFLLTGDTVLPGRLYAFDYPAFLATMDRMVEFAASRAVTHVLGCHIEMTTSPGRDYPLGCRYQPDEPPLQMSMEQLVAVRDAARSVAGRRGRHVFDDFQIFNSPSAADQVRLMLGGMVTRVRQPVRR